MRPYIFITSADEGSYTYVGIPRTPKSHFYRKRQQDLAFEDTTYVASLAQTVTCGILFRKELRLLREQNKR